MRETTVADEDTEANVGEVEAALRADTAGVFEIRGLAGRGGMAYVFLADEISLERRVAIKVLPPELTFSGGVERFKREARTAATLDHPHIIPIYRISQGGRLFWYAMKYLDGRTLGDLLTERGSIELSEGLRVLSQVADALDYAHEHGIIHRDVKPSNVLLDARLRAVVTDFGIAKAHAAGTLTASGAILGTPQYMAPEQWAGKQLSGAADQYAFAVMSAQVLTGRLVFDGDSLVELMKQHCMQEPDLANIAGSLGNAAAAILGRALAKSAESRFATVTDFTTALSAATQSGATRAVAPVPRHTSGNLPIVIEEISVPVAPVVAVPAANPAPVASVPAATSASTTPAPDAVPAGLSATAAMLPATAGEIPPETPARLKPAPRHPAFALEEPAEPRLLARWIAAAALVATLALGAYALFARSAAAPPAPTWTSAPIGAPAAGANHTCVVVASGASFCWGANAYGQLGNTSTALAAYKPEAVFAVAPLAAITSGLYHVCAISTDRELFCWGLNRRSQLGPDRSSACGGGAQDDSPCERYPRRVPLLAGILAVAVGSDHTCAVRADSSAACWGSNYYGQLGSPVGSGGYPVPVYGSFRFIALTSGPFHSCGLMASGLVQCWGRNESGQLGSRATEWCGPTAATRQPCSQQPLPVSAEAGFQHVAAGGQHTCAIDRGGRAWCWGSNRAGQLGVGTTSESSGARPVGGDLRFVDIAAGTDFTCGVSTDSTAYCWGNNALGQTGSSDGAAAVLPRRVPNLDGVLGIGAGSAHACAVVAGSGVLCWGRGTSGELGDGLGASSSRPVFVPGAVQRAGA